jgi:putative (di)nucleoside polyphosphate hydrolase
MTQPPSSPITRADLPPEILNHPKLILDYRPNVALIIRDDQGRLLWCERVDWPGSWQFPQGGIDAGEEPEEAMWREGSEELGLLSPQAVLRIEAKLEAPIRYDFTQEIIEGFLKSGRQSYIGQAQHYFLLRFAGRDEDLTLDPPDGEEVHREFSRFCWSDKALLAQVSPFKRAAYTEALRRLGV